MDINAVPIYDSLVKQYGLDFCVQAGYFEEDNPFDVYYSNVFQLPTDRVVLQFSGAFYPLHEGHEQIVLDALKVIPHSDIAVVIHLDHEQYRYSKVKNCDYHYSPYVVYDIKFQAGIQWFQDRNKNIDITFVYEDKMPNGCSRNFTWLYHELQQLNKQVYFLCGGDRANFALTFAQQGNCIVCGRETNPMYQQTIDTIDKITKQNNVVFIGGNNTNSSTQIRKQCRGY